MRIIEFLKKYRLGLLFLLSLVVFVIYYSKTFYPNYTSKTKEVQKNFLKMEDKMHIRLIEEKKEYNKQAYLRRKEQLKKENIKVIVNVDVYGVEEGTIDILTDAVATLKPKKRKKTKKS